MAAVVVLAFLATRVEVRLGPRDDRATGGVADIESLRSRDDVNVLFILIDTLRADHLGAWGYERDTSPALDALAASGIRFAHHVSQSSWTKCSMASLWTGLYPARTGVTRFDHVVSEEAVMPAEIFREAGFRTAGLFRNGWVESYFGFDQGFEVYTKPIGRRLPASVRRENPTLAEGGSDFDPIDAAIEFLRVYGQERWFLYLHLMDLHEYTYDEDSARFGTRYEDVYDNAILRTDTVLSQFFDHLKQQGHFDDTLIVIASDHGEAFNERGYEGHARYVYRETTHVPLILSLPVKLEPGIVVERITRNVDIWPTILDLLGLPALEDVDGRSQRDAILAAARGVPSPDDATPAIAHLDRTWGGRADEPSPTVSVVDGPYRYVRVTRPGGGYDEELFDAGADVAELEDVKDRDPEVLERLSEAADGYLERQPPWKEAAPILEIDEMQLNQLRALGYKVP
jgi:arylsulfatase A-like enzyme